MSICAIDFGTSNSAVAIVKNGVIRVAGSSGGKKTMPSLIYFFEDGGYVVGEEAITAYLANNGRGRLVQSVKTFLPDQGFDQTNVYGKFYTLVDFIAIILKALKSKAEEEAGGEELTNVVLGRPVKFSAKEADDQLAEKRLIEAATKVGFKNIGIQLEPIAAALDYESRLGKERLVLVGDFGGGTSDFTIMKLSPAHSHLTDRKSDILGTAGISIAGDAFDSQIMWEKLMHHFGRGVQYESSAARGRMLDVPLYLLRNLCEWHRVPFLNTRQNRSLLTHIQFNNTKPDAVSRLKMVIENNLGFGIFQAIAEAKILLSSKKTTKIKVVNNFFQIEETINSDELGEIIKGDLRRISECYRDLLGVAGVKKGQIEAVFLTGGSSNLPHIRQMFVDEFGAEKVRRQGDGFTSVVHGLALRAKTQF